MKINPDGKTVTLCARRRGCCPTMEKIDETHVKITDDDGNSVIMKTEQAALIAQGAQVLENNGKPIQQLLCD